jgi:hypothetical protein
MQALSQLLGLINLACLVFVVIKLFKEKGVLHGILGILCGLYTFIWGWQNAGRLGIKNIMLIWTAVFVANIALSALVMVGAAGAAHAAP